jgi:hypothetical protein
MNTNWSSPKTNVIAGILDLRSALQAGQNAVLVKARNEDCQHPIRVKQHNTDFRDYNFSIGYLANRQSILEDPNLSEFEKPLSLNYKTCYGTMEAVKQYYETGILSEDNFKGMGRSHLVLVKDMVEFLIKTDNERALMFSQQYLTLEEAGIKHFYDFYRYKHGSQWTVKEFKRKLWVVSLLDKEPKAKIPLAVKILNVLLFPMKYIPKRSVLRMPDYKVITFRIGGVTNGYSIDIQIPKKFGW